jgi:hypothetical protein
MWPGHLQRWRWRSFNKVCRKFWWRACWGAIIVKTLPTMKKLVLLLALSLALAPALRAELKLPAIIGDHMVLQQNQSNPIWGWDTPGAEITISLAGQSLSTKAGSDGTASLSHIQRPPRSSRGSEITKKAVVVAAESAIVTLNESLWFPKSGELSNTWAFLLFPAILWANSNRSSDASEIVFLRGIRSVVEELPSSHNLPKPNFLYLLS